MSKKQTSSETSLRNPDLVEIFEDNKLKLKLSKSSEGSLNGKRGHNNRIYNGRADKVKIYGQSGSVATFYDDQQFRKGENYVTIIKLTDEPIEVELGKNFVDKDEEAGDKIYVSKEGDNLKYKWIFVKRVKKGIVEKTLDYIRPLDLDDIKKFLDFLGELEVPYVKVVSDKVIKTSSNNYRVDNCSSVEFGAPDSNKTSV